MRTKSYLSAISMAAVLTCGTVGLHTIAQRRPRPQPTPSPSPTPPAGDRCIVEKTDSFPCHHTICTDCPKPGDPRANVLTISGTLVKPDGTAVAGKTVYAFLIDKDGGCVAIEGFDASGLMDVAPHADTDAKGRFSMRFLRLSAEISFAVGVRSDFMETVRLNKPRRDIPVRQAGEVLKLTAPATTKVIDVGMIVLK